jgi:hypothetical protein
MARTKERLYLRFRLPNGKQSNYSPACYDRKSRLRPGWCLVNGVEEFHSDGTYYQRLKNAEGKWTWVSRGTNADAADRTAFIAARDQERLEKFPKPQPMVEVPTTGFKVEDEVETYLSNVSKLAKRTYQNYKRSLDLFRATFNKPYIHQITRQDLQAFDTWMLAQGYDDRTRHNRIEHLTTFLRNKRRP